MNASAQLTMFEPEGQKLAELVAKHLAVYAFELRASDNLRDAGFLSASVSRADIAFAAQDRAAVCEMALQFEQLACLA